MERRITAYICYINETKYGCGTGCSSVGVGCTWGTCLSSECPAGTEWIQNTNETGNYGRCKDKNGLICYRQNSVYSCFNSENLECCRARYNGTTKTFECYVGSCAGLTCPNGGINTTSLPDPRSYGCVYDSGVKCTFYLDSGVWQCRKNEQICGSCSNFKDIPHCGDCDTAPDCPLEAVPVDENGNLCSSKATTTEKTTCIAKHLCKKGNIICDLTEQIYNSCYIGTVSNNNKCGNGYCTYYQGNFGRCASGSCIASDYDINGISCGGDGQYKHLTLGYNGCSMNKSGGVLECYIAAGYLSNNHCYWTPTGGNRVLCGQVCKANGTDCSSIFNEVCSAAYAGKVKCPYGQAVTDSCYCDTVVDEISGVYREKEAGDEFLSVGTVCCPEDQKAVNNMCNAL